MLSMFVENMFIFMLNLGFGIGYVVCVELELKLDMLNLELEFHVGYGELELGFVYMLCMLNWNLVLFRASVIEFGIGIWNLVLFRVCRLNCLEFRIGYVEFWWIYMLNFGEYARNVQFWWIC